MVQWGTEAADRLFYRGEHCRLIQGEICELDRQMSNIVVCPQRRLGKGVSWDSSYNRAISYLRL